MPRWAARDSSLFSDDAYQDYILDGVSRTFALTIPQLPTSLHRCVGNAYLLCRIADTIEDDPDLSSGDKTDFSERFISVVANSAESEPFARDLHAALSPRADEGEHDLIRNLPRVIRVTHSLSPAMQRAILRCVKIMATGMARFQRQRDVLGLADMAELDRYCYHVAGVVGEMLTELYAEGVPEIRAQRAVMLPLAVSFGQGLQMTNILKDIWTDYARGVSWLPRSLLQKHGVALHDVADRSQDVQFGEAIGELIGIAHGHLRNALRYTLLIPRQERGLRRFCLWALGMAILTLRKIDRHRDFRHAGEVRISRMSVRAVIMLTSVASRHDALLRALFRFATRGLPVPGMPVTTCREPLTDARDPVAYRLTG